MSIIHKFCWRGRRFSRPCGGKCRAVSAPRTAQTILWRTVNETIRRAFVVKAQLLDAMCLPTKPRILRVPLKLNATIYKADLFSYRTRWIELPSSYHNLNSSLNTEKQKNWSLKTTILSISHIIAKIDVLCHTFTFVVLSFPFSIIMA